MKPASFEYHRVYTVDEAVALLAELGEDAKIIAGGLSLAPMMNFRLARPDALVDVNPIRDLDYVIRDDDTLRVGALTRHRALEVTQDPAVHHGYGVLPRAARWIGHYPIRCRGTIGGSLAHSDPSAEWCLLASLYDADIVLRGPSGLREVPAAEWFTGFLTTSGAFDEMLVEVRFTRPRAYGAITEYARRKGDFAVAAAGVAFDVVDGCLSDVSIVLGGVGSVPVRARDAERMLEGTEVENASWAEAARTAAAGIDPPSDQNGDANYRRLLASTLTGRAFDEAIAEKAS